MLYQNVISPERDPHGLSRAFYEHSQENRPLFFFGKGIKAPNANQMGAFGDEITGNFFSPEMMSSVRYFSKNNMYN